jgi:transcriptional regulator with XRE-family HTH domain
MKPGLNVVGPQVRTFRNRRGWTQSVMARKLQLLGWSISVGSLGKLEAQLRRVPDCEVMFLAKVLGVSAADLFPRSVSLRTVGPQFQSGGRLAIFPTRADD